jgi:hypothetical protein
LHIILVSDRLATARSITLTWRHLILLFSYVTVRHAAELRLPFLQDLLRAMNAEETEKSRKFVRENINAMAVKLGQMQAQLMRLDTSVSGWRQSPASSPRNSSHSRQGPVAAAR